MVALPGNQGFDWSALAGSWSGERRTAVGISDEPEVGLSEDGNEGVSAFVRVDERREWHVAVTFKGGLSHPGIVAKSLLSDEVIDFPSSAWVNRGFWRKALYSTDGSMWLTQSSRVGAPAEKLTLAVGICLVWNTLSDGI